MTIEEALKGAGIENLDAEVLFAHVLSKDRSWLIAHPEVAITEMQGTQLQILLKRRMTGEPMAYIIGEKEFCGRSFLVNPSVLIPRPATEGLVGLALHFLKTRKEEVRRVDTGIVAVSKVFNSIANVTTIVDACTGSGCIAVTLALERPDLCIIATDISAEALEVAKKNAKRHAVCHQIDFRKGNLLEPVSDLTEAFIVVSNPPYIPKGEKLPREVRDFEPQGALFGGHDGMDMIKRLFHQARDFPLCLGIVLECKEEQLTKLFSVLNRTGTVSLCRNFSLHSAP